MHAGVAGIGAAGRRRTPGAVLLAAILAWPASPAGAATEARWLRVGAAEFTLFTPLPEKQALAWANEFAQFISALRGFMPVDARRLPRLTFVVFARERDFERLRPVKADGTVMEVAGFFARRPSWAVAGLAGTTMNEATRRTVFHEGTHWFLSGFEQRNPVWLEEGLAEVFSTFTTDGKRRSWGRPIEDHVRALQVLPALPLRQLLFLPHDSLHAAGDDNQLLSGMAYAQSWAFVHYLVFGQRDGPKTALARYLGGLRETDPDKAFRDAFGADYDDVDRRLRDYVRGGRYVVAHEPLVPVPAPEVRPAEPGEVREALARLKIGGGRHAEARQEVAQIVAGAPDDPRGYELKGELAAELQDDAGARAAFALAVAKGSKDFRPYFELAQAEHVELMAQGGPIDAAAARAIANRYEQAINFNPRFLPAFRGLGGIVGATPKGNTEDGKFLELGRKRFPDDGMIRLGLATLARRDGDPAQARELLDAVLKEADKHPGEVNTYARRLDAAWTTGDIFARVGQLSKERKYKEAVEAIDAQLAAGVDLATRMRLQNSRSSMLGAQGLQEAQQATREKRWEDARTKLRGVLEISASPSMNTHVRRLLAEVDQKEAAERKRKSRPAPKAEAAADKSDISPP